MSKIFATLAAKRLGTVLSRSSVVAEKTACLTARPANSPCDIHIFKFFTTTTQRRDLNEFFEEDKNRGESKDRIFFRERKREREIKIGIYRAR